MEVLLDANFIVSCIRKKIDFISELEKMGFKVLLPREIVHELKDIRLKVPHEDKLAIDIALKLFSSSKIKNISLGGKKIDEALIDKGKQGAYIATLDSYIKRNIPNKVLIAGSGNKLIIERS